MVPSSSNHTLGYSPVAAPHGGGAKPATSTATAETPVPPSQARHAIRTPGTGPLTSRMKVTPEARERTAAHIRRLQAQRAASETSGAVGEPAPDNVQTQEVVAPIEVPVELQPAPTDERDSRSFWTSLYDTVGAQWSRVSLMFNRDAAAVTDPSQGAQPVSDVNGENSAVDAAPALPKDRFVAVCKANGMTDQQVADVVTCWERRHIPLNEKTAPLFSEHNLSGRLAMPGKKDEASNSNAINRRGVFVRDGQKQRYWVKCYAAPRVIASGGASIYMKPAGISLQNPQFESRNLLVARLAEQLGWGRVTPKAAMGYLMGNACLVTEFVNGRNWLDDVMGSDDSTAYRNFFERNYRNGETVPVLSGQAKRDFEMISVLGLLVGDIDMNVAHMVAQDSPITSLQCVDWDMSFGKNLRSYADVQKKHDPNAFHDGNHARWPSAEALRELAEPFLTRLTPEVLRDLAQGLITPEETEALVQRFESMRAYLQKQMAGQ